MKEAIATLVRRVHREESGAVDALLAHPKVREVVRIRASKMKPFPWERLIDRRLDAQRAVWHVARSIDEQKAAKLRTDGVVMAYLSTGVRNQLFRQVRTDLALREATFIDTTGRKRFELQPKLARAPFELALAQVDALADPVRVLEKRESVLELQRALATAPMDPRAREVLTWRMAGLPGVEMRRRLGRSGPVLYGLLRQARAAVRDRLYQIRAGTAR